MNRCCHGDLYAVNGERFYRCLLDSTVLREVDVSQPCPRCQREIAALDHGDVPTRTTVVVEAFYDRRWFHHSEQLQSMDVPVTVEPVG